MTSNVSAMPATSGGAALLVDPGDHEPIAESLVEVCGPQQERLRAAGPVRAAQFTWSATAERTLTRYRDVYARRQARRDSR